MFYTAQFENLLAESLSRGSAERLTTALSGRICRLVSKENFVSNDRSTACAAALKVKISSVAGLKKKSRSLAIVASVEQSRANQPLERNAIAHPFLFSDADHGVAHL